MTFAFQTKGPMPNPENMLVTVNIGNIRGAYEASMTVSA